MSTRVAHKNLALYTKNFCQLACCFEFHAVACRVGWAGRQPQASKEREDSKEWNWKNHML